MNRTTHTEQPDLTADDIELTPWDSSEFLDSPEAVAVYLNEALAVGDAQSFAYCLGQAAKAAGMTEIARRAGMSRESLYEAVGGLRPQLEKLRPILEKVVVALDGEVLEGRLPSAKMKLLEAWMVIHQDDLRANWELLSRGEQFFRIDPLK